MFYLIDKNIEVTVPTESVTMYKNSSGWKEFNNITGITSPLPFELSGINYNIISPTEVELVYRQPNYYLDSISFPSTVEFLNKIYSVTSIGEKAFYGCRGLKSITIPNSVKNIGIRAFSGCNILKSITFPSSITNIGRSVFEDTEINEIKVEATIPPMVEESSLGLNSYIPIVYVPNPSLDLYKNAFGWKDFFNIKGISTQVQELDEPNYGIRVIDRNIEITNAKGSMINVYDISGRVLFTKTASQDSENIQLSNKGVYLLAIDGFNRKIIVD